MLRPAMGSIISGNDSYYKFVIAVAKRARNIADEIEERGLVVEEKPVKIAVHEFARGDYKMVKDEPAAN